MSALNNRDYILVRAYQAGVDQPRELAAFMGQIEVESGGFNRMHENFNYSAPRLLQVFPGRNGIDTLAEARAVTRQGPEAVANAIYGGDWGRTGPLGNTERGDGWRFHGRGYIQLTGRYNYTRDGRELGLDLVKNPDLAADRTVAADIAIHYWQSRVVPRGHQLDISAATRDINGGYNHLGERRAAVARWERRLTPEVMAQLSQERSLEVARGPGVRDSPAEAELSAAPYDPQRRQQYEGRVTPFSPVAPITQRDLRGGAAPSPADSSHPDHALLQQIREGVASIERQAGRPYGESSERLSRSLLVACKGQDGRGSSAHAVGTASALTKVDHVVASQDGSRAFAIEGVLTDPAHRRVSVEVANAVRTPVEDADRTLAENMRREFAATGRSEESVRAADAAERVVRSPALA